MKKLTKALTISTLLSSLLGFAGTSLAATVPEGTVLANRQILRLPLNANPTTIDISQIQESVGFELSNQLYEPLVVFDENGKLQPGVATSWEHSEDFKTWTFHLREDAKFSDGTPVKAQDFITAWTRLLDPNNAFVYSFYLIDLKLKGAEAFNQNKGKASNLGLKALDDHTLEISLEQSVPWFLEAAANVILSPIPTELFNAGKWPDINNLVSNGAYHLKQTIPNDSFVFERNTNYWDNKNTVIDKVTYYIVPKNTSAFKRLQSGELDASDLTVPALVPLAQEDNLLKVVTGVGPRAVFYTFNINKAPFDDAKLRKAFQLAIDIKEITKKALRDTVFPTTNFIPKAVPHGDEMKEAKYFDTDQAINLLDAKKLFAEAGYSEENPLRFTIDYSTNELKKTTTIAIVGQLKRAFGKAIDIKLRNTEWKTFLDERAQGKYQFFASGWGADYTEASTFTTIWNSYNAVNDNGYRNPEYDKTYSALFATKTEEERVALYQKMNTLLQNDVPAVMIYANKDIWALNPKLKGLNTNQCYRFVNKMYFVK